MTQYLDFVVGAALLAAGYIGGRVHRPRKTSDTPRAICACGHSFGEHGETGHCRAEVSRPAGIVREWVPCACVKYVGPKPIEDLYSPGFLPPTD